MARGVGSDELIRFVLEGDRALPEAEQTIFSIRPSTGHDANVQTRAYLKALTEKRNGTKEMDIGKTDLADRIAFKSVVKKVENYSFPQDYYAKRKELKEHAVEVEIADKFGNKEKVWFTPEIEDEFSIELVAKTLLSKDLKEVINAAEDYSILKEGEKK